MKISNESKVGVFAAITITLLILGYSFMRGKDVFTKSRTFYLIYDNIGGLMTSNPVVVNGYRIGQVTSIKPIQQDSVKLLVEIEVSGKIDIPKNSTALLKSENPVLGGKMIEIIFSKEKEFAQDDDTLPASTDRGISAIIEPLQNKIDNVISGMDSLLNGKALKSSMHNLDATLHNLNLLTAQLNEGALKKLDQIFSDVQSITGNLKNNNERINSILVNAEQFSDSLQNIHIYKINGAINDAKNALAQFNGIMTKINEGKGTAGLLINNDELYNNLKSSASSLDVLLKDLKDHPKRYVHFSLFGGKKDKKDKDKK